MASSLPFPNRYHVAPKRTRSQQAQQSVSWTPRKDENRESVLSSDSLLDRGQSKLGIRNVFARSKTDHQVICTVPAVHHGDGTASPSSPRAKHVPILAGPESAVKSMERPSSFLSNVPRSPPVFLPPFITPLAPSGNPAWDSPLSSSKSISPVSVATAKPGLSRGKTTWGPPPLFQAYTQAIKHAALSTPSPPLDTILRLSGGKRVGSSELLSSPADLNDDPEQSITVTDSSKTRHRRGVSGSRLSTDGSQRLYLLTTSGLLLQYARDGSFDRLPEKVLRLGKSSVAFASDAVPGRHWVLQVSQSMHSDGTSSTDGRSLFSRFPFWNSDAQKTTNTFLMILDSAEELDSWISLVRREIEVLGGSRRVTETGKPRRVEQSAHPSAEPSSHRRVGQHSCQLAGGVPAKQAAPNPKYDLTFRPWSPSAQDTLSGSPSGKRSSTVTSVASCDDLQLESLRNSTYRDSYMSSGQRTFLTSQSSSPSSSPVLANHSRSPVMEDKMSHVFGLAERRSSNSMHPQGSSDYANSSSQTGLESTRYENVVHNRISKPRVTTDVTVRRSSRAEEAEQLPSLSNKVNLNEEWLTCQWKASARRSSQSEPSQKPAQFSSFQDQKFGWRNSSVNSKHSSPPPLRSRHTAEERASCAMDQGAKPSATTSERPLPLRSDNASSEISEQTVRVASSSPSSRRRRYSAASFVLQQTRPFTSSQPLIGARICSSGSSALATAPSMRIVPSDRLRCSRMASEGDANQPAEFHSPTKDPLMAPKMSKTTFVVSKTYQDDTSGVVEAKQQDVRRLLHGLPPVPPPNRALPPLPPMRPPKPRRVSAVRQNSAMVVVE